MILNERGQPYPDRQKPRLIGGRQPRGRMARLYNAPPLPLPLAPPRGITASALRDMAIINHPGHDLNPETVIAVYGRAERGWSRDQCDMFTDVIEMDGHLRAAIESRLLTIVGKPWSVIPGQGGPGNDRQTEVLAEICHGALKDTNFLDALGMSLAARAIGFAGSEIHWRRVDGDIIPVWFTQVPFNRFAFDAYGEPRYVSDLADMSGIPLDPGLWWWSVNSTPFTQVLARAGLMRTATWYSLYKRWSWRDWVIYAERFGLPLVVGKYDPDGDENDYDVLTDAVENLGDDGYAVHSKHAEIDINEAQRGGDSNNLHAGIVHEANLEISKLFTGATLNMETGSKGSYAQADIHANREFHLILADMQQLVQSALQRCVFGPMRHYNGLTEARLPELKVELEQEADPEKRVRVRQMYHAMGLPLSKSQLYAESGLRPPANEADTLAASPDK